MKLKSTIAVGLAVVGLTACSKTVYVQPTTVAPEETTTTTTLAKRKMTFPTTTVVADAEADYPSFLLSVSSLYDGIIYVSDDDLYNTGISVCNVLWTGGSMQDVKDILWSVASDQDTANFLSAITVSAVFYLCPDQKYKLDEL